jgi:iron complex transport system substrate-binding protein
MIRAFGLALLAVWQGAVACPPPATDSSRLAISGGSITEIVYLLNESAKIVAADRTSNYPTAATKLPSIGYVRNLSTEGVLSIEPTLILAENDTGPPIVLDQLRKTGVEIAIIPEQMDAKGIISKVECVASVINADPKSTATATAKLAQDLAVLERLKNAERQVETNITVAVILGLDNGQPTVGGINTSANSILEMAGAANAFESFEGWKPVPAESMLEANPDIIIMPIRSVKMAGGLEKILSMQAIKLTNAAMNNRVIAIDGMALLGFGPRTLGVAIDIAKENQSFSDSSP